MRGWSIAWACLFITGCTADLDHMGPDPSSGGLQVLSSALEVAVPGDKPTIQAAVDSASAGDVVKIAAGIYTENIALKSGVILQGAGSDKTVLRGYVKFKNVDAAAVIGMRVTAEGAVGVGNEAGIGGYTGKIDIRDNIIEGFKSGIGLESPGQGQISGNLIRKNGLGIDLYEGGALMITNNVLLSNHKGGVVMFAFGKARVVHNTVIGNGFALPYDQGGAGIVVGPFSHEIVQNNVVVSNKGGINSMSGSNSKNHHNLVWGNVNNYVGAAKPGAGDLSVDPKFNDPGNKDYRLVAGSAAIDAAVDWKLAKDFAGQPRLTGAAPDLGAFEFQPPIKGDLVINEVMANPLSEGTGEFVELFNPHGVAIDAAGLVIGDGDANDVVVAYKGGATLVPAGGYAVILDAGYNTVGGVYTLPAGTILLTVPNAAIGSGLSVNDPITLSRKGAVVSTLAKPFDPGNGVSAERIDAKADDLPANWVPSPCGASPGKINCIAAGGGSAGKATLVISEVMATPVTASKGEFVEVYNFGDKPVELGGLVISDGDSTDVIKAAPGKKSSLPAGKYGVILDPDGLADMAKAPYFLGADVPTVVTVAGAALGNGLAKSDPITLFASDGKTVVATFAHPAPVAQQSVERKSLEEADIKGNWMPSPCAAKHSAGKANCAAGGTKPVDVPVLRINEVMANPLDEDRGEFIELYNPGDKAVNAAGLLFTDGDATDTIGPFATGGSTTIPAKGYAVILDSEYLSGYAIGKDAVLLAPANTSLGNGLTTSDPLTLLASDGLQKIDTFSFPSNPGNGVSVERKGASGDVAANWVASTCAGGSSPGAINCVSGGGTPEPVGGPVITEVMANPLVESSGEFVEILNLGSKAIEMAGLRLSDGDATDTLQAFKGGKTVLPAGGYAVVLDSDYPTKSPYVIDPKVILLTTGDKTIGSGLSTADPITLQSADGAVVLSTFKHPFNPGNGISAERLDPKAADKADNWAPSKCKTGSSPGAGVCNDGKPGPKVVDVNTGSAADLQQVAGIGPTLAGQIVAWRKSHGHFESLAQLTVLASVTPAKIAGWQVAEEGEAAWVIGLAGAKEVKIYNDVAALLAALPPPKDPGAAAWAGQPVRIQRAAAASKNDNSTNQNLSFGDWGDVTAYEPAGKANIAVHLDKAPGEPSYKREQTDHADAMADWDKEDGDPYLLPDFYRWPSALSGWGQVAYGGLFSLEGVVEVADGAWRLRVRADADKGIDRLVLIERWLPASEWKELKVVWSYGYKSVVVSTTSGLSRSLPHRLALAHPCRAWWLDKKGQAVPVSKCLSFGKCGPMAADWKLFNQALAAWKKAPPDQGKGHCFTYKSTKHCFTVDEEKTGLDVLNKATMTQLKSHCYSTTLAGIVIANRPHATIKGYDALSGVGPKSMWNLLVCYVRSGDWPPAAAGTVAKVLQGVPGNEYQLETVTSAAVKSVNGKLFEICDPGTKHCIKVFSYTALPTTLSKGDTVKVKGQVRHYDAGGYWNLVLGKAAGTFVQILKQGS